MTEYTGRTLSGPPDETADDAGRAWSGSPDEKDDVGRTLSGPPDEPQELPSDLNALAHILEAAMHPGAVPPRLTVPTPHSSNAPLDPVTPPPPQPATTAPSSSEPAAFDEVARSLAAAEACVPLLAQATGLMRLAALDVVRAETARAGGLLQLLRYLRGDLVPPRTSISSNAVLQRVTQAAESERRLRGIALTYRSNVTDVVVGGDETLLANTLLALMLATFALLEQVQNARVVLSVSVSGDGKVSFTVAQDHVAAPALWSAHAASDDVSYADGAVVSAVAIGAARRTARESNGRFTISGGEHSSLITLVLPVLRPTEIDEQLQ
jgi:hypothetical protein